MTYNVFQKCLQIVFVMILFYINNNKKRLIIIIINSYLLNNTMQIQKVRISDCISVIRFSTNSQTVSSNRSG